MSAAVLCGTGWAVLFGVLPNAQAQAPTPVPVVTWRYDLTHAGQNTQETALTPANVNASSFGKLFSLPVDSTVYAQPLYVPGLTMGDGQVHNVLFVATENDSIYAFDADSNGGANAKPLWQVSLLTADHGAGAGATAVPWKDTGSPDVAPTIGITGTPTINPATNTMYVVANTKENGAYFSRLHAINILTGTEQANSPVNITATVAGTGNGSSGGQLSFSALWENQRTALDYYNGYVYFGYGAHGDNGPWHGWLFAYDATTLKQTAALCLSPNGDGAGLWAAGAGLPIDTQAGKLFVVTGNGTRSNAPPFDANSEFGESVVAFSLANGQITPVDEFTSFNYATLNSHDWDQGAGGLLMLPDQQGANPHMLVTAGKEGRILVLNRDKLGGYAAGASSNTNALQDISSLIPQGKGFWSTPAYWNGHVYLWAEDNVPMMFDVSGGVMNSAPDSQSTITSAFPDPTFSVSSNGAQDGIAWAVRADQFNTNGPAVLYAWDANDLSKALYESDTNATRDAAGPANKFSIPLVTDGKVYVPAHGEVDVYGLLNGQPTAAAPVISPDGGSFSASQPVTLSSATSSATIYYTVDGSTPTPASTQYAGPITVSSDTTVKAIASAPGYVQSSVSSATFTFATQTPAPTFSPAAGTYMSAQTVTLSDTDANAKIYFTTDGSAPSASSNLYSSPIQVSASETIKAIGIDPALTNSNVSSAAYVIQSGGNAIDFSQGFSNPAGLTFNGSAVATNDTRLQLTNGGTNQAGSVFWSAPINIQAFTTTFEFQLSNAQGNGFTFTIQNTGANALGGNSAGLGYQGIQKSVAVKFNFYDYNNEGSDSTGVYTDGQAPVNPSTDISPSGIELGSGDSIQAQVTYDGATLTLNLLDLVTNDKFTMSQAINIPQIVGGNTAYVGFTGGTGGLTSSQKLLTWAYSTQPTTVTNPSFALSGSPVTIGAAGQSAYASVTITPSGGFTGNVAVACSIAGPSGATGVPTCSPSQPPAISNSQAVTAAVNVTTQATTTPGNYTMTVTGTSGNQSQSATIAITVAPPGQSAAQFALTSTAVTLAAAGASGTSTITITPSGGFTGTVALTCAIATTPSQPIDVPTCSVSQPPAISGAQAVTATLTVNTMGGSSAVPGSTSASGKPRPLMALGGGTTLAALFFFWLPRRRRRWQALLGLILLVVLIAGFDGCSSTGGKISSGTTAGEYTITVTGTSGSMQASTTVDVSVD